MMYLLLSIALCVSCNLFAAESNIDTIPLRNIEETVPSNSLPQIDPALETENAVARAFVPIEAELSVQKLAMIYKKLLHDSDALEDEEFEDENLRVEVEKVIQDRIHTVKKILDREAPELALKVEEEYAAPRKRLIILGTVAVFVVGASVLALFSYDPITGTWGKPRAANAKATLARVINKFSHAFDQAPAAPAAPATPAAQQA
ncbi:hypothetical protein FJ365_03635 [Candidatus Dependentiae bacterium]|nr:hypothetical protein [Candidatus Dependentiae bacterium]